MGTKLNGSNAINGLLFIVGLSVIVYVLISNGARYWHPSAQPKTTQYPKIPTQEPSASVEGKEPSASVEDKRPSAAFQAREQVELNNTNAPKGAPRALYDRDYVLVTPSSEELQVVEQQLAQLTAASEQKQRLYKNRLKATDQEIKALQRAEIMAAIRVWQKAWEEGDQSSYFASYHPRFANNVNHSQWRDRRLARLASSKNVRISLSNFTYLCNAPTELIAGQCKVEFTQDYQSSSYSDSVRKVLILAIDGERYKIESESVIPDF